MSNTPESIYKMDRHTEEVYLQELDTQCTFAINAINGLNNVMPRLNAGDVDQPTRNTLHKEVFRTLHSFLIHSSNASKLLWPSSRKAKPRGAHLRDILNIKDTHPLKNRTLRNHLEHFDERLDDWAETSVNRNYAQDLIMPRNAFAGFDPKDCMRWYDPSAKEMIFRGSTFNIVEILDGLADVKTRIVPVLKKQIP